MKLGDPVRLRKNDFKKQGVPNDAIWHICRKFKSVILGVPIFEVEYNTKDLRATCARYKHEIVKA